MSGINPRWFLRMSRWARHPPATQRVILGAVVLALCLALAGAERMGWLPSWFALSRQPFRP